MAKQGKEEFKRDAISSLLRQVRNEVGLTQVQMAERLGQTQSVVSKLEAGERRLEVGELISICDVCGIRIVDFAARLEGILKEGHASG